MKKKIVLGTITALSLMSLTACTVEAPTEKPTTNKEEIPVYSQELSAFVYQNKKESLYFAGTLDYVHSLTVKEIKEEGRKKQITSEIVLYHAMNVADGVEDEFYKQNLIYTIEKNVVKEHLEEANFDDPKNFVTNKVVLKTPLEEGNQWTQKVLLPDGKEYIAETTIEKVAGKKGERKVFTSMKIKGEEFEEYPNHTYEEKSVYEEGKGLVSFERFYPNEEGGFVFEYHKEEVSPFMNN